MESKPDLAVCPTVAQYSAVLLLCITGLSCSSVVAQGTLTSECPGVECMQPEFDVGFVFEPQAGQFGITELMIAALHADIQSVRTLIKAGADVNTTDQSQSTALMWAVHGGDIKIVQLLLASGANVNARASQGATALVNALSGDRSAIAIALLEAGANPNGNVTYNRTFLEEAAETGQVGVVNALIVNGADVSTHGASALFYAVKRRHQDVVVSLLDAGVDVNAAANKSKQTAIYAAANSGDEAMLNLLLSRGANPNPTKEFSPPMSAAVRHGHTAIINTLMNNGAPATTDYFFIALRNNHSDSARTLLARLDLNALGRADIDRLLIMADSVGDEEMVQQLLGAAASPHVNDDSIKLLFRKNASGDCNLAVWDPRTGSERSVYAATDDCNAKYFVADGNSTLFVLESDEIRAISLNDAFPEQTIELPTVEISRQMDALKIRIDEMYEGRVSHSPNVKPVAIGYLPSGELALATHTWGPADGTYAYLFGRFGSNWAVVAEKACGRMDNGCRFAQMNGREITDWPLQRTAWHPSIRMNRFYAGKDNEPDPRGLCCDNTGAVRFNYDNVPSTIRYTTSEYGHCSDECTYTRRLELQLGDEPTVILTDKDGNNSFAEHYVLVQREPEGSTELLDARNGQSVLGQLGMATWVE